MQRSDGKKQRGAEKWKHRFLPAKGGGGVGMKGMKDCDRETRAQSAKNPQSTRQQKRRPYKVRRGEKKERGQRTLKISTEVHLPLGGEGSPQTCKTSRSCIA